MSDNNGDQKPTVKLKERFEMLKPQKQRSRSLGILNISNAEIRKITGVADNSAKPISDQNKQTHGHTQIPGSSENIDDVVFSESLDPTSQDLIFKPKRSVARTPTKLPEISPGQAEEKQEESSGKRPRSETTPDIGKSYKRQCEENENTQVWAGVENNIDTQTESGLSEKLVMDFFSAFDKTADILSLEKNGEGAIYLTTSAQESLKNAQAEICKLFMLTLVKIGKIEKENIVLQNQLQQSMLQKPEKAARKKAGNLRTSHINTRTYADILNAKGKNNEILNPDESEEWKTPKITRRHETIIRVDNTSDPKEVMKSLKEQVNMKDMGGAFKSIKHARSGAIIVESHSKDQQDKLKIKLKNNEQFKVKENQIVDPMFMITGIERGFSDTEFLEELERLNSEIVDELQCSIQDKIKVIAKKKCRNPAKENWILQAPPEITKWFLKKRTVYFDLVSVYVQEHVNLAQCFKCSGFDHVAKYCKEQECCHRCGGQHKPADCQEDILKCPNCEKMKLPNGQHSARDINCPVYKRRLARYRNNVNYEVF